jgi:hypothetical protein
MIHYKDLLKSDGVFQTETTQQLSNWDIQNTQPILHVMWVAVTMAWHVLWCGRR